MTNRERETPIRIVVKRARHHEGHHGGAWKVAFADFMTAMFALFLVLWIVNQSSDVKAAVAGYFADPLGRADEFGSSIVPGEGTAAANPRPINESQLTDFRRDRLQQLGDRIRHRLTERPDLEALAQHVEITVSDDGLRIELLEDSTGVFFRSGDASPSPRGAELLALVGAELAALPNDVLIEGHTDARPFTARAAYTNWELSADRANTARRILTASGLPERQVAGVRGLADRQLRTAADPLAASNRRVTILMRLGEPEAPGGVAAGAVPAPGGAQ